MIYDYIVIGQGLAGSILAYELVRRKKRIMIIDERAPSTSSKVAAGLSNPLTGPKMVKSWKAELLFPYLKSFYKAMQRVTKTQFFSERTIYRPFSSIEELNDWEGRSIDNNYQQFIKKICGQGEHSGYVKDDFGGVEVLGCVLDVPVFLKALHNFLSERCTLVSERFEEEDLDISDRSIRYHEMMAQRIVWCSGYKIKDSKYFGWLPLSPVKGELLYLKTDSSFQTIYNKSCFIIPQRNGLLKAGSTYNREDLSIAPTEHGRNEISRKLDALLRMNYEVVGHEAGIRPGTVPRRPLIGAHPRYRHLFVFNGFGTKGVSLAPFFSDQFAKCLEDGKNLDQEVDIKKYYSLYFNSRFYIKN